MCAQSPAQWLCADQWLSYPKGLRNVCAKPLHRVYKNGLKNGPNWAHKVCAKLRKVCAKPWRKNLHRGDAQNLAQSTCAGINTRVCAKPAQSLCAMPCAKPAQALRKALAQCGAKKHLSFYFIRYCIYICVHC